MKLMRGDLEYLVGRAISELREEHRPMWSATKGYTVEPVEGKDPVGCVCCFPGDGSWPCISRQVIDELAEAIS